MLSNEPFSIPIRVYYEDTDAGGLVYHTNYLKFMERSRTEWLRHLGIEQKTLLEQSIGFVVKELSMKNSKAAAFNDMLSVSCQVVELKKASMVFRQHAYRVKDSANTHNNNNNNNNNNVTSTEKELLVSAEVRVACVDLEKMKPIAIPGFILREIKRDV
ncbi:tol-pal system-associated acyl-CoA thioesterase [Glaciecola sp. 33A]|uniref:tol-pal system-associated acyl-CoA thioesterase n=1 Tax=Glaciecola sp. 33A TaxID=2057807 RepID=UPI000C31FA65|nr:tol-pal system-associated acyl-CoA thioesterase [Glaciecola sp. 33A]PKI01902.1 4-hydroxybenzoyl-CoA thioesterase [Glaciecola sp. 33A]